MEFKEDNTFSPRFGAHVEIEAIRDYNEDAKLVKIAVIRPDLRQ